MRIIGGKVLSKWKPASSTVEVLFQAKTETDSDVPLLGLLPNLYDNLLSKFKKSLIDLEYVTPRGSLKLLLAKSFTLRYPYIGILPGFPTVPQLNTEDILSQLQTLSGLPPNLLIGDGDSYWTGKSLGKISDLVVVADQMKQLIVRDYFLSVIKDTLKQWFSATDGDKYFFFYDTNSYSLIGSPSSYGSDTDLNDHHFHYGYFLKAISIVGIYDYQWAMQYKDFVNLIVSDTANFDSSSKMFPTYVSLPFSPSIY